jgi:hypothetical protein
VGFQPECQAAVDKAFSHFEAVGLLLQRVPKEPAEALRQGPSFRVREPHCSLEFEYYGSNTVMARACMPTVTKIARVGHVVIGSADFAGTYASLTRKLGFVVSDFVEDRFAFMRGFPTRRTTYNFGMEEFPDTGAREQRMLEPVPESLDTWGAVPGANFAKVGVIEAA